MQTLKQILGREAERSNLINAGFCVALVLVLVAFTFGLLHLKVAFESAPAAGPANPVASPAQNN